MAFREVSVVQIKEVLRHWLRGEGERTVARAVGCRPQDRTALHRGRDEPRASIARGDEEQLTDELVGQVVERVRPHRPDGHGAAWRTLLGEEERIKAWVDEGLTVVKIGILLCPAGRDGPAPDPGPLRRRALRGRSAQRRRSGWTTRRPGSSCQVDFGRLGLVPDGERRRVCQGLIFTACFSRH